MASAPEIRLMDLQEVKDLINHYRDVIEQGKSEIDTLMLAGDAVIASNMEAMKIKDTQIATLTAENHALRARLDPHDTDTDCG